MEDLYLAPTCFTTQLEQKENDLSSSTDWRTLYWFQARQEIL